MRRSRKFRLVGIGILLLLILGALTFLMTPGETALVDPEAQPILSRFIEFHADLDLMSVRATRIRQGEESVCVLARDAPDRFARHRLQGFDDWNPYHSITLDQGTVRASSEDGSYAGGSFRRHSSIELNRRTLGISIGSRGIFESRRVLDPLAWNPFSGKTYVPSPTFPLPLLMGRTGEILEDAREVRFRGEEVLEGIPCIKLEFHHPRSTTPQYVWIASEGDPQLVQVRNIGKAVETWRFSRWAYGRWVDVQGRNGQPIKSLRFSDRTYGRNLFESMFDQDHQAVRQDLPNQFAAESLLSRFIEFHENLDLMSVRASRIILGEESICVLALGAPGRFARHRIRGFEDWPNVSITLDQGRFAAFSAHADGLSGTEVSFNDALNRGRFKVSGEGGSHMESEGFRESGRVFDPLARDPFWEESDAPFPAFAAPALMNRSGHFLKDILEMRFRGEEFIGGIPCIKMEFRPPQSDHPLHMWIASEGDPHLVQIRNAGNEARTWRFSRWAYGGNASESLFGQNHSAILRELLDLEAQSILSRFIEFHEDLDFMRVRAARITPGEESICVLALGAPGRFARHRIRGFDDWPNDSITLDQGRLAASSTKVDGLDIERIAFDDALDRGRFKVSTREGARVESEDAPESERVFDPLARDPFSEESDAPFPAFASPALSDRSGHFLRDASMVRYRGEEIIGGIPCIKLEFHHPRSAHAQSAWIASQGDPSLVQIRSAGDRSETWRFSGWAYEGTGSESLFGPDHQAIRQELLGLEPQALFSRFITFHEKLDLVSARAARIKQGEESICVLALGAPGRFARHRIRGFDDWPNHSIVFDRGRIEASLTRPDGSKVSFIGIEASSGSSTVDPSDWGKSYHSFENGSYRFNWSDDASSQRVFNPLAGDPLSDRPDGPFPAFSAPMFMDPARHVLRDARQVRYLGEEILEGIPCVKMEFHHPLSAHAQLVWIASEGDPHLMQFRSVEEEAEIWRFSGWTRGGKDFEIELLFGEDHEAIHQELLDRME